MGISTFTIDGMSGRGLTAVSDNQALLGRLNFVVDIYRSLDILAKHPRVDPNRVIMMGFSRGGQAALYSSVTRFQKLWNKSGIEFAAYIPFYPDCGTTYREDDRVAEHAVVLEGSRQRITPLRFGTILFLASELMFFAGLFAAYFSLRAINDPWPPALDVAGFPSLQHFHQRDK